jgi:hypothetical protein
MTLLCLVKRLFGWWWGVVVALQEPEDLAGDDPFEASFGFSGGLRGCAAALEQTTDLLAAGPGRLSKHALVRLMGDRHTHVLGTHSAPSWPGGSSRSPGSGGSPPKDPLALEVDTAAPPTLA